MFIAALFIIAKTWKQPKYIFHNLVDKQTGTFREGNIIR